jgi:hypothetical protein
MKKTYMNYKSLSGLLLVIIIVLYLAPFNYFIEGYKNIINFPGLFPQSLDKPLLNDYPLTNRKSVSNNSSETIWQDYPIFSVGSYKQLTNNLRFWSNPDDGKCTRAEFCKTLYDNKQVHSNIIEPLPPAEQGEGARVNYYRSEPNYLSFSIPTNENILY